jgi:hypothetical protein
MGRTGGWGGMELGAEWSLGPKGVRQWGRREASSGAEGSMGRKGVWGAQGLGTHHPPLHTCRPLKHDISQPAGRHLHCNLYAREMRVGNSPNAAIFLYVLFARWSFAQRTLARTHSRALARTHAYAHPRRRATHAQQDHPTTTQAPGRQVGSVPLWALPGKTSAARCVCAVPL